MGRFECEEEDFPGQSALWEQSGRNALRGRRGQTFLREIEAALLAMPEHRLIAGQPCDSNGDVCLIGQLGVQRKVQSGRDRVEVIAEWKEEALDYGDYSDVDATVETMGLAQSLGMTRAMASYVAFQNDQCRVFVVPYRFLQDPTPEQRWEVMLRWVRAHLVAPEDRR